MTHDPLIAVSLLGTARMSAMPPPPDASLENTWNALAAKEPADAVLLALALTRALHRGGAKAQPPVEGAAACPVESRAILTAGGVDALMRLLRGEFPEILPEWLGLASASGRVLPGRVFPELLAAANKNQALRPTVRLLAGERGLWIARRHPKFSWLLEDQAVGEEAWEDGLPAERIAWLRQTRASDPSRALEAVKSHWSGEDGAMRESILRLISEKSFPSDESWLEETALHDRRQEVRELAATCLAGLIDSAFRQRAIARISACVKIQRRLLKRVIAVEPAGGFDPAWASDGLKEKPPQGTGEKAWWLRQITGLIPLADWPELLDCAPADLFGFPLDGDWREPLLLGWIDAARRFPQRALPEQFIPFLAKLDSWPSAAMPRSVVLSSVLDAVPDAQRFGLLDGLVKTQPAATVLDLLARCGKAPPAGKGKAALAVIDVALASNSTTVNRPQARALALCIPQEEIQTRIEILAKLPELSSAAEEFATTLEFRRSLLTHFQSP